ncbi:hypothetical protein SynMITS9220_01626 [Synechococcus sp. MIT S9220]|nr:hypothetical protein SynMITS9220_01626 [Synechococcus sp. MIT S9220]
MNRTMANAESNARAFNIATDPSSDRARSFDSFLPQHVLSA